MLVYTCMACDNFSTSVDGLLVAHQSICTSMCEEKRDYRESILALMVGEENVAKAQQLARDHAKH